MAAGISYALSVTYLFSLLLRKLGITIHPVVVGSVSSGCINDSYIIIFNERNRLPCTIIRKTEKNDICAVYILFTFLEVMTLVLRDPEKFQILSRPDAIIYLQSCGSALSVNIYLCLHHFSPSNHFPGISPFSAF